MYATGSAPVGARDPYAGISPADAARSDGAQTSRSRAASGPEPDAIAALPQGIGDGANAIPGSPMEGMLAVFGDFLRAAFEQLGQMLAGLIGANQPPLPGDPGPPPVSGFSGPRAPDNAGAPAGDLAPGTPPAAHAHRGRGHGGHARTHMPQAGLHGPAPVGPEAAGPLRPGQRLDLGQGESVTRARDGSLQISVGGEPDASSLLMPSGML